MADKYIKDLTKTSDQLASGDLVIIEKADGSGTKIMSFQDLVASVTAKILKNNGTTTEAGYALDAQYGKTLTDSVTSLNSSVGTAGSNASTALQKAKHGFSISSTGSVTSAATIEDLYTKLIGQVGDSTGVTTFTANISGQVFGGIALIASSAYGAMLLFNYAGAIRLCSRNNSTNWSIKSVTLT